VTWASGRSSRISSRASSAAGAAARSRSRARRGTTFATTWRSRSRTPPRDSRPSCRCRGSRPARPAAAPAWRQASQPETCGTCRGQGQVRFHAGLPYGGAPLPQLPRRGAHHQAPVHTAAAARGGYRRERLLKVTIPAGVENGNQLPAQRRGRRERAPGRPGRRSLRGGSTSGPTRSSVRDGAHLICELPLTFPQVALGDEVEVPVLDGAAKAEGPGGDAGPASASSSRARACPTCAGGGRGDAVYEVRRRGADAAHRAPARAAGGVSPCPRRRVEPARLQSSVERMKQLFGS